MSDKVLSVIIPVYNMENYLKQCLDSILIPETDVDYEVVVINDGSTDSSLSIAREYEEKYPNIYKVVNKENGGYGSCFNSGIKLAQGKYVKVLDSDDYFSLASFPLFLDILKSHNEDIIINDVIKVSDVSGNTDGLNNEKLSEGTKTCSIFDIDLYKQKLFIHNFCFKRELLLRTTCPEKCFYTDTIIVVSGLESAFTVFYSGIGLYFYRIQREGQSISKENRFSRLDDWIVVSQAVIQFVTSYTDANSKILLDVMENVYFNLFLCLSHSNIDNKYCFFKMKLNEFKKNNRLLGGTWSKLTTKRLKILWRCPTYFLILKYTIF